MSHVENTLKKLDEDIKKFLSRAQSSTDPLPNTEAPAQEPAASVKKFKGGEKVKTVSNREKKNKKKTEKERLREKLINKCANLKMDLSKSQLKKMTITDMREYLNALSIRAGEKSKLEKDNELEDKYLIEDENNIIEPVENSAEVVGKTVSENKVVPEKIKNFSEILNSPVNELYIKPPEQLMIKLNNKDYKYSLCTI